MKGKIMMKKSMLISLAALVGAASSMLNAGDIMITDIAGKAGAGQWHRLTYETKDGISGVML